MLFTLYPKKHTGLPLCVFCFRKAIGQPSWVKASYLIAVTINSPACHKMAGYISQVIGNCFLQEEIPHKFTRYPKYRKKNATKSRIKARQK
ncbi:hypothetical protein AKG39_14415 [Acetobacterium bakii]|uniref:Uncharacterized protein n=1 Tax=Acetobacterium bakii TaxID=52689 RepID=A0A0L6TXN8_9FIRM|nr:hypothetical protein AKG39_14415 [Acetobacterium bakii]